MIIMITMVILIINILITNSKGLANTNSDVQLDVEM